MMKSYEKIVKRMSGEQNDLDKGSMLRARCVGEERSLYTARGTCFTFVVHSHPRVTCSS
jgi:hypothetical protein